MEIFKDIIIVGAGPAGLGVASQLYQCGIDFIVLEQGNQGDYYQGKSIFTVDTQSFGLEDSVVNYIARLLHFSQYGELVFFDAKQNKQYYGQLIDSQKAVELLAKGFQNNILFNKTITGIEVRSGTTLLKTEDEIYRASLVIDATGAASVVCRMLPAPYTLVDNPIVAALYGKIIFGIFDPDLELTPVADCANGSWITPLSTTVAHLISAHYAYLNTCERGKSAEETIKALSEFGYTGIKEFLTISLVECIIKTAQETYGYPIIRPQIYGEENEELIGIIRISPIEDYSIFKGSHVVPVGSAAGIVHPLFWDAFRRSLIAGREVGNFIVQYYQNNRNVYGLDETTLLDLQYKDYEQCMNIEIGLRDWRINGGGVRRHNEKFVNGTTLFRLVYEELQRDGNHDYAYNLMLRNGIPKLSLLKAILKNPYIISVALDALNYVFNVKIRRGLGIYQQPVVPPPIPFDEVLKRFPHIRGRS